MKNIPPPLDTVRVQHDDMAPGLVHATSACDHCQKPATQWPTGLMSIDREVGVFTCDMVLCPECAVTANFAPDTGLLYFIRTGVEFAWIDWYWFVADTE